MLKGKYRDISYYNKQLYYLKFHGGFYLDSFLKKNI